MAFLTAGVAALTSGLVNVLTDWRGGGIGVAGLAGALLAAVVVQAGLTVFDRHPEHPIVVRQGRRRVNPSFTGRSEELAFLASTVPGRGSPRQVRIEVVHGLSGTGKSQLAAKHLRDHEDDVDVAWMVDAVDGLGTAVDAFHLPPGSSDHLVRSAFEQDGRFLLAIDGADSWSQVVDIVPTRGHGQVVITTQNPTWDEPVERRLLSLGPLPRQAAVQFLMTRSGDRDQGAAQVLARVLGGLPLALEQVATYVRRVPGSSLGQYLRELGRRAPELFEGPRPDDYRAPVLAAWDPSVAAAGERFKTAPTLLRCLSQLGEPEVPLDWFGLDGVPGPYERHRLGRSLEALARFSLVTWTRYRHRSSHRDVVVLHPLVAWVTRIRAPDDEALAHAAAVVRAAALAGDRRVIPHARALSHRVQRHGPDERRADDGLRSVWRVHASQQHRLAATPSTVLELVRAEAAAGVLALTTHAFDDATVLLHLAVQHHPLISPMGMVKQGMAAYSFRTPDRRDLERLPSPLSSRNGEQDPLRLLHDGAVAQLRTRMAWAANSFDRRVVHLRDVVVDDTYCIDPRVSVNAPLVSGIAYAFATRDSVASDGARTEAWDCYERAASNPSTVAAARQGQALLRRDQGRLTEAVALLDQALAATDPGVDPHGRGITLLALAEVLAQRGDPSDATTALGARREAQRLSTTPGDDLGLLDELLARTAPQYPG